MDANKGILQSKFTDSVTNKTKTETWKAITEKVNAVGVASRTIYEVKQKWKGLFSMAKSPVSTAVTIILHEGTQTVTENLWKTILKSCDNIRPRHVLTRHATQR